MRGESMRLRTEAEIAFTDICIAGRWLCWDRVATVAMAVVAMWVVRRGGRGVTLVTQRAWACYVVVPVVHSRLIIAFRAERCVKRHRSV